MTPRRWLDARSTYTFGLALATGALLMGMLVPFTVGDREAPTSALATGGAPGAGTTVDTGAVGAPAPVAGGDVGADAGDDEVATSGEGPATPAPGSGTRPVRGDPANGARTARGASDRGVTANAVEVGILLFDIGSIGRAGIGVPGASVDEQRKAWDTMTTVVNAAGGAGGRKVVPTYATYDLLSEPSKHAACLALTEDAKVFTVLEAGGYSGPPLGCVVDQHETPMLIYASQGAIEQYYRSGRLFSVFPVAERQMRIMAAHFDRHGALTGKRLGILSDDQGDGRVIADALHAALERLGHRVAHRTDFSADPGTGASQVPVEVSQMRTAGVEVILEITNGIFSAQFAQAAEGQGYRPRYLVTDVKNGTTDTHTQNWPPSYDGSLAVTSGRFGEASAGLPESTEERECRTDYERATGEVLERGANYTGIVMRACGLSRLFATSAGSVGPMLTRPALVQALEATSDVRDPVMLGIGHFGPGRHDAAATVRTLRWHGDCRCWKAAGRPGLSPG